MQAYRWDTPLSRKCFSRIQQFPGETMTLELWMDCQKPEVGRAGNPGVTTRRASGVERYGAHNPTVDLGNKHARTSASRRLVPEIRQTLLCVGDVWQFLGELGEEGLNQQFANNLVVTLKRIPNDHPAA
jgi:hypothetical protein